MKELKIWIIQQGTGFKIDVQRTEMTDMEIVGLLEKIKYECLNKKLNPKEA